MKLYKIPIQKLNQPVLFQPRGSAEMMSYRYYPSWSTHTIVLFHGLVSSSLYLAPLAHRIAERKIAQVIIPDWRGHGDDQRILEWRKPHDAIQDFEEMIIHFKSRTAVERISFLGHSFGAKWLIKVLQETKSKIDNNYLVAPYIRSEQMKLGWIEKRESLYKVNWPEGVRTGKERLEYPAQFLDLFDVKEDVLSQFPFHLVEAGQDEILNPLQGFELEIHITIPDATHMGIVMEPKCIDLICDLIEKNTLL